MGRHRRSVSGRMGRNIISGQRVGDWVANELGIGYLASRSQAIGLEKDGKIIAGIVYENWTGRSIVCHMAFPNPITARFLSAIFDYAFNVCKVEKVIGFTPAANVKAQKLVEKMGFSTEGRIKDVYPDGDMILNTMAKENCRYLGKRYGQEKHNTTTRHA